MNSQNAAPDMMMIYRVGQNIEDKKEQKNKNKKYEF